jgi:hypothetical protein
MPDDLNLMEISWVSTRDHSLFDELAAEGFGEVHYQCDSRIKSVRRPGHKTAEGGRRSDGFKIWQDSIFLL